MSYRWDCEFRELFEKCLERCRSGDMEIEGCYDDEDIAFLGSIGYRPREFFDFVEDFAEKGEPSLETAVLIAAVRRDYFETVQRGEAGGRARPVTADDVPARDAELGGYAWLPRIIAKARAKLRGELDADLMYGCGGDRAFLREADVHPADFLRAVWAAGDDDEKILACVRGQS